MAGRVVLLLWIGVLLAFVTWFVSYDVGGREPPCFEARSELQEEHPDAVEFRNAGGGWSFTHSCEAVAADGTVLGRVSYPETAAWVVIALVFVAPLAGDAALRRRRRRQVPAFRASPENPYSDGSGS
jgi:hypothetical protein